MDRGLGPGTRVCRGRRRRLGRLVRLHERPADQRRDRSASGAQVRPDGRRHVQPAGLPDRTGGHRPAGDRHLQVGQGQRRAGAGEDHRADRLHLHHRACRAGRQLPAVLPHRLGQPDGRRGRARRGRVDLFRLRGLRRGLHRRRGNQEPEPQHPDRPDRFARGVHRVLHAGQLRRGRRDRRPADVRRRRRGHPPRYPGTGRGLQGQRGAGVQPRTAGPRAQGDGLRRLRQPDRPWPPRSPCPRSS